MVFLNPSILLGLIAASIPILIHILNFRKLQKVEFSTLAFLKELQKSKIKKIKIKQWILLLLRTLIIVFLVLAFARPTLENVNLAGASSTAKTSSVFIIDNSFSMSYVGNDGSNFNRSKKITKEIITKMEDGDEFIIFFSGDSVVITTNKESALVNIDKLDISLGFETTISKLDKAVSVLNNSKNINKEIFLFTDYQFSSFIDDKDSISNTLYKKDIKLYSFDMSLKNTGNYSVSHLNLENAIVELNKPLTFTALVHNYSENNTSNLTASLFLNNKRVAQQNVSLAGGKKQNIKFETSISSNGLIEASVELEDDNILQDNICYFDFLIPENIKVLIVYDNISDITFLKAALNSTSISNQIKVTLKSSHENVRINTNNFNIIFFVSSNVNQFSKYNNYLVKGGKLVFIPPSLINKDALAKLKVNLNLPSVENIITASTTGNNYSEFGKVNFEHPIFENLFKMGNKKEIESPNIYKYIKFSETRFVKPIIRLIDNSIFMGEYKTKKGTVLFINSAAVLSWSNFPIKGIFAPIISRIVFYLSSTNDKTKSYSIGESIPVAVSQITFPIIDVSLPIGSTKVNIGNNNKNVVNFYNSDIPGSYKFYNNSELIAFASVNVDARESDLTKMDAALMEKSFNRLFGNNYLVFDPSENYADKIKQARYGTELWKYLLIIALFLALIEMYIARSEKKDLIALN